MQLEARKYLFDMQEAIELLQQFVAGKSQADYLKDRLLQSGVERQFEIIGEAAGQLAKMDPNLAAKITDYKKVIGFRNVLIHAYADVDDLLVWDIVQTQLPRLHEEVKLLGTIPQESAQTP